MKHIVGAGLAGLIAAHAWPSAQIIEASPQPKENHKALLRFRSDAVAKLIGIEFRRVLVHKGIWFDNAFVEPNIKVANLYAQKVLGDGRLRGDRSIWKVDAVERFIAPDDLYAQLLDAVGDRISWGTSADFSAIKSSCVSTAPLPITLKELGLQTDIEFRRAKINVRRWRLHGADVFQTIYYPAPSTNLYRASITGDVLIAEISGDFFDEYDLHTIEQSFGISLNGAEDLGAVEQKYGKIEPIDSEIRKALLFSITHQHGVYSLGRFATWRNILLDDVVDDIAVIKRLAKSGAAYDLRAKAI